MLCTINMYGSGCVGPLLLNLDTKESKGIGRLQKGELCNGRDSSFKTSELHISLLWFSRYRQHVALYVDTKVSEAYIASIFRVEITSTSRK
jgi:hypothetical protein